jgi:hypothetical protein
MGWFAAKFPVSDRVRAWLDESFDWLLGQFGADVAERPVILPTPEFFPGSYTGRPEEIPGQVARVAAYLGVPPNRYVVEVHDHKDPNERVAYVSQSSGRFGGVPYLRPFDPPSWTPCWYRRTESGQSVVRVRAAVGLRPMSLVAAIAHEFGHELLAGQGRMLADRPDFEPMADLVTVLFGFGIFTANAAAEQATVDEGDRARRHSWLQGFLDEKACAYALARYTLLRRDPDPDWARYLDTNPKAYLKRTLRRLR